MKPLLRVRVPLWSVLISSALLQVGPVQNSRLTHYLNWRGSFFFFLVLFCQFLEEDLS